jgi:hypothetical protein
MQENVPATNKALALAEQRLTEAAAELEQRAQALQQLQRERDEGRAQASSR